MALKIDTSLNNFTNPQQLNITTLLDASNPINATNATNNYNYENGNIVLINNILNNNTHNLTSANNNKYEIKQYLGEGIQGSLYMAFDKNNKKYICKKINLNSQNNINSNQLNQINFELNLLKYLSSNRITRDYINPCVEHKIINNQIFTIFPVFDGYSLNHIKKYLLKIDHTKNYKILFHLIKVILHGMAKIHQHNISHQNINENSILVSTYINHDEMKVKFTDFGLGCGLNNNYINNVFYDINSCNSNSNFNKPIKISNNIIKKLSNTEYLRLAQKNDIILLCMIFIKLLLFFENIEFDLTKGYNDDIKNNIKKIITEKFLSQISKYRKKKVKEYDVLGFISTNNETKRDILEYLNIFNDYILCETQNIQSCQYILDKLIIYEKYKNEEF